MFVFNETLSNNFTIVKKTLNDVHLFQYVVVRVNPDQMMITAGTNEPCAIVELHNITDGAKNKENAEAITNFIESTLAIPKSRYIMYKLNFFGKFKEWKPYWIKSLVSFLV